MHIRVTAKKFGNLFMRHNVYFCLPKCYQLLPIVMNCQRTRNACSNLFFGADRCVSCLHCRELQEVEIRPTSQWQQHSQHASVDMNQLNGSTTPLLLAGNWSQMQRHDEYRSPLDILAVKILFILLYVVVFTTCFIGESHTAILSCSRSTALAYIVLQCLFVTLV